jgi:hypothetical protein
MPVHRVIRNGQVGYQWGQSGRVYTGPGAQARAQRQGQAVYAAGYREKTPPKSSQ